MDYGHEPMVSILIVDSYLLSRDGLKYLIGEEYRNVIFGEARTAAEALLLIQRKHWDLILLDPRLQDGDGFSVLENTLRCNPETHVVVLCTHELDVRRAQQSGATGWVKKDARRAELVTAIKTALAGKRYINSNLPVQPQPTFPVEHAKLSPRERKVIVAVASGKRTSEIAADLNLNIRTISTYKRRILDKLKLKSTADLVRYVMVTGLTDQPGRSAVARMG